MSFSKTIDLDTIETEMARDWLLCKAGVALERNEKLPEASECREGEILVDLTVS